MYQYRSSPWAMMKNSQIRNTFFWSTDSCGGVKFVADFSLKKNFFQKSDFGPRIKIKFLTNLWLITNLYIFLINNILDFILSVLLPPIGVRHEMFSRYYYRHLLVDRRNTMQVLASLVGGIHEMFPGYAFSPLVVSM